MVVSLELGAVRTAAAENGCRGPISETVEEIGVIALGHKFIIGGTDSPMTNFLVEPAHSTCALDAASTTEVMPEENARKIAQELERRGLLADWLQFGPDGERLDMVLMMNTEHQEVEYQRHFAHCVFNGTELTENWPSWLSDALK